MEGAGLEGAGLEGVAGGFSLTISRTDKRCPDSRVSEKIYNATTDNRNETVEEEERRPRGIFDRHLILQA